MAFVSALQSIGTKIVEELVSLGKIDKTYARALRDKYKTSPEIAAFLLSKGKVSEEDLVKATSVVYDLPFVHLVGKSIDKDILSILPESVAKTYFIVPYEQEGDVVKMAVGRPYNLLPTHDGPLHKIEEDKGIKIELVVTTIKDINWALEGYSRIKERIVPIKKDEARIVHLENLIIPKDTLYKFPREIAVKYQMVVFGEPKKDTLKVAAVDPSNPQTQEIVRFIEERNGITIDMYKTTQQDLTYALQGYAAVINPAPVKKEPEPITPKQEPPHAPAVPRSVTPPIPTVTMPTAAHTQAPAENITPTKTEEKKPDTSIQTNSSATNPKDGAIVIGAQEVQSLQAPTVSAETAGTSDTLEERNLDAFLGHEITSPDELATIVRSGFIPKIVAAILSFGIFLRASDVHLEPLKDSFRLRYRVDGELKEYLYMPQTMHPAVTSRIKIFSNLKIDEQRVPQDGRYDAVAGGHEFDVRVSSLPTVHGEKIVMRLLDKSSGAYTLENLGLSGDNLKRVVTAVSKPYGVVLATGPTGSGKSTTLYAILNKVATPKVNVITLEDPVEYEMKGVNQVQVKPKIGFSFAEGLRSILRQDPNIIMVGEIRDGETAELATHAALTGHLVLTTLHTNNASGALPRLINMGVEPFLITSSINAIIAQRLVRRLCEKCKVKVNVPEPVMNQVKDVLKDTKEADVTKPMNFFGPKGCSECHNTGFNGRVGIYEVLVMSDAIEEAAIKKVAANEIDEIARKEGMVSMRQEGIIKALQGLTTLDEVFKVTSLD